MDCVCLQRIIPAEIWQMVAGKLLKSYPMAVENLANSSPFFQNLLAPKRTTFLVNKALEVVGRTVWREHDLAELPIMDLIKYRQVCSQWNSAADNVINKLFQFDVKETRSSAVPEVIGNIFTENDNNRSVNMFLSHFEGTHPLGLYQRHGRSPFILKHISICISEIPSDYESYKIQCGYLRDLGIIISLYGVHIQSLTITQQNREFFNNSSRFQRWLMEMPNLTKLSIHCEGEGIGQVENEYDVNDKTFKMNRLRCLETCNLPSSIFNMLIKQNSQVSTLLIKSCKSDYDFFTFPLPNLKNLEIKDCSDQILIKFCFPEVDWPLESLKLDFGDKNIAVCGLIFKVLQKKFDNTLVNLEVSADLEEDIPTWSGFKSCRLALPKLKKIKLDVCANLVCLDFLLPMRNNLEEISVSGAHYFRVTNQNWTAGELIVQFTGFEENMLDSNIWEIFTSLKKFKVEPRRDCLFGYFECSYSRKEWMRNVMYYRN